MARGFIMLDIEGLELTSADRTLLRSSNVGGVILFSRNYESPNQVINLISEIRKIQTPSLLIAVDHEGGRGTEIPKWFYKDTIYATCWSFV